MSVRLTWMGLIAVGCLLSVRGAFAAEHTKDSLAVVKQKLADKTAVLIDVREQAEWDAGHLDAAILLPLSGLHKGTESSQKLMKGKIVYTHCNAGIRSVTAGEILSKQGYDVRPLKAGYQELLDAGFAPAKKK
jgi:phage shock protein E